MRVRSLKERPAWPMIGAEFKKLSDELFGSGAGVQSVGKGKVYAGQNAEGALKALNVAPDFDYNKPVKRSTDLLRPSQARRCRSLLPRQSRRERIHFRSELPRSGRRARALVLRNRKNRSRIVHHRRRTRRPCRCTSSRGARCLSSSASRRKRLHSGSAKRMKRRLRRSTGSGVLPFSRAAVLQHTITSRQAHLVE